MGSAILYQICAMYDEIDVSPIFEGSNLPSYFGFDWSCFSF